MVCLSEIETNFYFCLWTIYKISVQFLERFFFIFGY